MKVNVIKIKALNPCKSRLDAFLVNHASFSGTMHKFLNLENVPHTDKVWVYFRLIPKELIGKIAADIAESVLNIYESKYPNDNRPRLAIEAARSGVNCRNAYDAYNAYTAFAYPAYDAYAAAYAAAFAAFAAYNAAFAYPAYAAHAAAHAAARSVKAGGISQEAIQIAIMKKWVKVL